MRPYRYFYAIAPSSPSARWFNELLKVERTATPSAVVARWSCENIYLTEADFVPTATASSASIAAEDEGLLITIMYNASSDASLFAVFDARNLVPRGIYPLSGLTVPFHAHGIVCLKAAGGRCFTNP